MSLASATPPALSTDRPGAAMRDVHAHAGIARALSPVAISRELWGHRDLLWQMATRAIAERHKGSALGLLWLVAQPLLMLSVYTFVFAIVWQATWPARDGTGSLGGFGFAWMVFAGLVTYEVFAGSVSQSPSVIVQNPNYVKKVVFPVAILPLSPVVGSGLLSLVGVGVLLIGRLVTGGGISATAWLFPLTIAPMLVLAGATSLVVAGVATYVRDVRAIVQGVLLQVLFFLTPIVYPMERVPEWVRGILAWNPLAIIVTQSRRVLVEGLWPQWGILGLVLLGSLVAFVLAWGFFARVKRGFADVL